MGEGFVVMQSNDVDIYYYMDEPGMSSLKVCLIGLVLFLLWHVVAYIFQNFWKLASVNVKHDYESVKFQKKGIMS